MSSYYRSRRRSRSRRSLSRSSRRLRSPRRSRSRRASQRRSRSPKRSRSRRASRRASRSASRSISRSVSRSRSRSASRSASDNVVYLSRSTKSDKKYMVQVGNKTIHFGARGMSDYTLHKDAERRKRYVARHKARENWSKSGMKSAGFWSLWILWNKPSLSASIADTQRRFGIKIRRGRA